MDPDLFLLTDRQTDRLKPHRDVGRADRLAGQTNLNLYMTHCTGSQHY